MAEVVDKSIRTYELIFQLKEEKYKKLWSYLLFCWIFTIFAGWEEYVSLLTGTDEFGIYGLKKSMFG